MPKCLLCAKCWGQSNDDTDWVTGLMKRAICWGRYALKSHRSDGYFKRSSAGSYGNAELMDGSKRNRSEEESLSWRISRIYSGAGEVEQCAKQRKERVQSLRGEERDDVGVWKLGLWLEHRGRQRVKQLSSGASWDQSRKSSMSQVQEFGLYPVDDKKGFKQGDSESSLCF